MKQVDKICRKARNIYCRLYCTSRRYGKMLWERHNTGDVKLAHVGLWSAGNMGDTVLSTCIRDLFSKEMGRISWRLMDMFGDVDGEYVEKLNQADAVIIGGHGAFLPDTHPNDISNWEFACSEAQYDEIQAPIIIFAIGYNYFKGQERSALFESNIRKLVERSAFFGLRNRGSVREIQSFLPDELKRKVVYQPCPTMISRMLYPALPTKKKTQKIAFNVALDRAKMRMGENADIVLTQIAIAMQQLGKKGYEVHFIAHMNTELDFIPYMRRISFDCPIHVAATWDVGRATRFYNEMDVVVGMRGHGIWIPFGVNCQIISLGNQNKTKWFLEDIEAPDWFIDINENPETLAQQIVGKFEEIHEFNGEETDARLLRAQQKLYDITKENLAQIRQIIGEHASEINGGV